MPNRYLILRLSALGDVVFALEALAALRAADPTAEVDWLVEDRASELLAGHAWLRRTIVYPRRYLSRAARRPWLWPRSVALLFRHLKTLRAARYDAALDLHGNFKSGLHLWLVRARRKLGFAPPRGRELSWLFARERVALGDEPIHRAEQGRRMVAHLVGGALPRANGPLLPEEPAAALRAAAWLALHPLGNSAPIVCLAPGSSRFAAFKRWPAVRFAELARVLTRDGLRVVVATGPGEGELARSIVDPSTMLAVDSSEVGLPAYLEVLRGAACVVAADSGPLHLAGAVGTRAVALFGPKDPSVYGPRQPGSIVLRYPTGCVPCGRRACVAPICVQGIAVVDARAAVLEIVGSVLVPSPPATQPAHSVAPAPQAT